MMADNVEHVISYWMMYQKFHSPALGGFAVVSHWLPFLLFAGLTGLLADRFDIRRLIQTGMVLYMIVSVCWGIMFLTDTLTMPRAMVLPGHPWSLRASFGVRPRKCSSMAW